MSGFVAVSPAVAEADEEIGGDGWWPPQSTARCRAAMRIGGQITVDRLREAILGAIVAVTDELGAWRQAQQDAGAASLADVASPAIGDETRVQALYRRAVFAMATAELVERHHDISAGQTQRDQAAMLARTAPEYRRDATYAIRAIQGRAANRVALL